MPIPSPVSGVLARIGRIESAFTSPAPVDVLGAPPPGDFEPFGEAYQRAVAAAGAAPAATPTAAPSATPVATRLVESLGPIGRDLRPTQWSTPGAGAAHRIGGFGAMPVPEDLAPLGNGRVPTDRLVPIAQSGHRLYAPAATAWDGLVRAASAEGIELRITDSYRSYDQQVDLAERKGLYRHGGLAATPGTSNHGWGLAVDADVTDPATLAWLRRNGPRFGFVEAVPREPWHWEYRPHQV